MGIIVFEREFRLKVGNEMLILPDPDPEVTPDDVMDTYSNLYPQLTNSTVSPMMIENDKRVYEFITTTGVKG